MAKKLHTVMVTGSSGYVASGLIPLLSENFSVFGVDSLPSLLTNTVIDISSIDFQQFTDAATNVAVISYEYSSLNDRWHT